jgi:23S rRNA (guanosine2251-2'-O)-methyltransferase
MKNHKSKEYWLYGKHSGIAALNNPNRSIKKVLITRANLNNLPNKRFDNFEIVENRQIANIINVTDAAVQGIALLTSPLKQPTINDFVLNTRDQETVIILDQLSDPNNIGAIFRSALAFGASAVITTLDNSPSETASLVKSAAGAFESIPFIEVINLTNTIKILKNCGYWVIGLDGKAENSIKDAKISYDKIAIVLGSEENGMRVLTKKHCDLVLSIPIMYLLLQQLLYISCADDHFMLYHVIMHLH